MENNNQEQDKSQKTQDPTPHRKEKAREKGQIPHSKEINHFFMISAFLIFLWFGGKPLGLATLHLLKNWTAGVATQPSDLAQTLIDCRELVLNLIAICGIGFLLLVAAALASGYIQGHTRFIWSNLKPQFSRVSLSKGVSRLFSFNGMMEFFKAFLKLLIVCSLVFLILMPEFRQLDALSGLQLMGTTVKMHELSSKMLFCIVMVTAGLAVADYTYQWFKNLKELRMSRQDLKDEQKHLEGDPSVKEKQRKKRNELAEATHISQAVPEATVVITNPLHYAVALKWNPQMPAPIVAAKGADFMAFRIRELAKEHFVPIFENPPLARVLYSNIEVDQEIKPEHYKAVAQIIRYVLNINSREEER